MRRSVLLGMRPGVVHGFSTVADTGASLRPPVPDGAWRGLAAAAGGPGMPVAWMSQVHGATVLEAQGPGPVGEADALLTRQPGLLLAVRTADCVPVLVASPQGVAAIHAGWRGVAARVVPAAVAALGGASAAVAAVGPAIGGAVYEVGPEVVDGLRAAGIPLAVFLRPRPGRRPTVDLAAAVAHQLRAAGVGAVEVLPDCTFQDRGLHSHRRDGDAAGRNAGLIGWR